MSEPPQPAPETTLTITSQRRDAAVVVTVVGEVDMDTAPQVSAAVTAAFAEIGAHCYVLDLTNVTYLGSAGLTALLDATRRAESRSEPLLVVVDANRPVIRPIEITGLDEVLRLYHSLDEALRSQTAR